MNMERKIIDVSEFKSLVRKGVKTTALVSKQMVASTTVDDATRRATFIATAELVDRGGDIVEVDGIDFDNYLKNGVVLWDHDRHSIPIGKAVSITKNGKTLIITVEFQQSDVPIVGPLADAVFLSIKRGFISACSIGFITNDFSFSHEPGREGGMDIHSIELVELSITNIPCLPQALVIPESVTQSADESKSAEVETTEVETEQKAMTSEFFDEIQEEIAQVIDTKSDADRIRRMALWLQVMGDDD